MFGFVADLAAGLVECTVQSVKVVNGFALDRAQDIHGFALDRAHDILAMFEHAAETAKACTVGSAQKVQEFAQGGAQAILGMVEHATKTAKIWMGEGASLLELLWKLCRGTAREEYRSRSGNRDSFTVTMNKINSNTRTMMAWSLLARMERILSRLE